jgi:hypothetical protein
MGIEINDPNAYRQIMFDLVGNSDHLSILEETPDKLKEIISPYSDDELRSHPVAGKWSPLEILGHYVDVEWNFGIRLRFVLCEENPPIIGYNQDLWVKHLQHNQQSSSLILDWFRNLRMMNIHVYKSLTPIQMKRYGTHNERGEESIETMLTLEAGHDLHHQKQLIQFVEALNS